MPRSGPHSSAVTLLDAGNGYYNNVNVNSGKALDDTNGSTTNGTQVQQSTLNTGYFNIINGNSGKAVDDTGGSLVNGTQMQQYTISGTGNSNQQWQITSLGNGYYKISNRTSGLVLDLTNGQWASSPNNPNQSWQFVPAK
jgi:hypothetical protein